MWLKINLEKNVLLKSGAPFLVKKFILKYWFSAKYMVEKKNRFMCNIILIENCDWKEKEIIYIRIKLRLKHGLSELHYLDKFSINFWAFWISNFPSLVQVSFIEYTLSNFHKRVTCINALGPIVESYFPRLTVMLLVQIPVDNHTHERQVTMNKKSRTPLLWRGCLSQLYS